MPDVGCRMCYWACERALRVDVLHPGISRHPASDILHPTSSYAAAFFASLVSRVNSFMSSCRRFFMLSSRVFFSAISRSTPA